MKPLPSAASNLKARIPGRRLTVTLLAVLFTLSFAGPALAAAVTVTSSPEKRGSVTPGLDNVVMQKISLRVSTGTTQLTALKLSEFGTADAAATILAVKIYKETNGAAKLQTGGITPDTQLSITPTAFSAESNTFTFSVAETLSAIPTTYYIVYDLKPTAPVGTTIGSSLVDKDSVTVSSEDSVNGFTNLRSREITVVGLPHASVAGNSPSPFSKSTNLCQTCHAVHLAPNFEDTGLTGTETARRLLTQPYFEKPSIVNTANSDVYNGLCLSCHDGTGAGTDIKSKYNSGARWAGHLTKNPSTFDTGWKAPPAGQSYDAGKKMPCMVCHDVHVSSTTSYKMLADGLVSYAKGQGWQEEPGYVNNRVDKGNEMCLVCHRRPTETSRTTSSVMGIDMTIVGHETDAKSTDPCTSCHADVHALDYIESQP